MVSEPATAPLHFDSDELAEVHFTLGKERKPYVLREASAETVFKYRNEVARVATLVDGQLSKVGNVADADGYLLSMCLYEVKADGGRQPVPITKIRSWPNRVVKSLVERVEEMSDLSPRSIAQLEKQAAKIQEKINKLRAEKEGAEGNGRGGTNTTPPPTLSE